MEDETRKWMIQISELYSMLNLEKTTRNTLSGHKRKPEIDKII